MEDKQFIYALVAFSSDWMKREEFYDKCNKDPDKTEARIKWLNYKGTKECQMSYLGKSTRGFYSDRSALVEWVTTESDTYAICEGYYTWLVVETHVMNTLDGSMDELWFKYTQVDEDEWRYVEVSKPECLKQVGGFAH